MLTSLGSKHFYLWWNYEYGSISTECYDLFPDYQKEGYIFYCLCVYVFECQFGYITGFQMSEYNV